MPLYLVQIQLSDGGIFSVAYAPMHQARINLNIQCPDFFRGRFARAKKFNLLFLISSLYTKPLH